MKIVSNGKALEVTGGQVQDIYSTEEQVVGRWIDGKPLYRKVVIFTTPGALNQEVIVAHIPNAIFVQASGAVQSKGKNAIYTIPSNALNVAINNEFDVLWYNSSPTFIGAVANLIVEYTKTTDQATIELPAALTAAPVKSDSVSAEIAQGPETSAGSEEVIPSFYDEEV